MQIDDVYRPYIVDALNWYHTHLLDDTRKVLDKGEPYQERVRQIKRIASEMQLIDDIIGEINADNQSDTTPN